MSLYTRGEPVANQQFRQNTEKRAGQMIGVTSTPKRCRCIRCEKMRTQATGRHTRAGFVCHGCGRSSMGQGPASPEAASDRASSPTPIFGLRRSDKS